jgi:hypothetical protein
MKWPFHIKTNFNIHYSFYTTGFISKIIINLGKGWREERRLCTAQRKVCCCLVTSSVSGLCKHQTALTSIWRVAANILKKLLWTANKAQSSSLLCNVTCGPYISKLRKQIVLCRHDGGIYQSHTLHNLGEKMVKVNMKSPYQHSICGIWWEVSQKSATWRTRLDDSTNL